MVSEKDLESFKKLASVNLETALFHHRNIVMRLIEDLEEARRLLNPFADAALGRSNLSRVDLLAAAKYLSDRGVKWPNRMSALRMN